MKICALSDTHCSENDIIQKLEPADLLVFAGDMCCQGKIDEVRGFVSFIKQIEHLYTNIVFIAGNHDWPFYNDKRNALDEFVGTKAIYLENDSVVVDGIKIYGSPETREFCGWAFNRTNEQLHRYWSNIPKDINILVNHSVPFNVLDYVPRSKYNAGDTVIHHYLNDFKELKAYIGGHLHYQGGQTTLINNVLYVNASICDEHYDPTNPIVTFEI